MYEKIESKYILNKINKTLWKKHEYIDFLIYIYEYIKNGMKINSFAESIFIHSLIEKYRDDYLEILKEFSIELYQNEIKKEKQEKLEINKNKEKESLLLKKIKKDWINAGGKK